MPKIKVAGRDVLLNVVFHDSGEEPESSCTNLLIAAKVADVVYQHLNVEPNEAIDLIVRAIDAKARLNPLSGMLTMLTVVLSKFHRSTEIDFAAAVSTLAKAEAMTHRLDPARAN